MNEAEIGRVVDELQRLVGVPFGNLWQATRDRVVLGLADGTLLVALVNIDPDDAATVRLGAEGARNGAITGERLTAPRMDSRNTFAAPTAVGPVAFRDARWRGDRLEVRMPAKSVVVLRIAQ